MRGRCHLPKDVGKETPELGVPDSSLCSKQLRTSGHPMMVSLECPTPDVPAGHQLGDREGGPGCQKGKIWFIGREMME